MYGFIYARCKFLNYRRNMSCYECEHKRPPDEYTSNQMDFQEQGPTRTWPETGLRSHVPEVSDAWNFDFDDNESDGADVAAFEFADSSKGGLEKGNFTGSLGRSELHERKPVTYSSRTGFNDFDDEEDDDDLDSYEIDSSSRAGKESGVARRNFSELEESDLDDYGDFDGSKKNLEGRSHDCLTASDDEEELINQAHVKDRRDEHKFDSDSDYDDGGFGSDNAKRNLRTSFSNYESDADYYGCSTKNNLKGGKFGSKSNFDRVRERNRSGRAGMVQDQEDSWDGTRRKGGQFGNDGGFRGSQRNERRNGDGFDRRRENVPGKQDDSFRFNSRHHAGNNRSARKRFDSFRYSDPVDRPRRINVR
jgi:hypothetical protein